MKQVQYKKTISLPFLTIWMMRSIHLSESFYLKRFPFHTNHAYTTTRNTNYCSFIEGIYHVKNRLHENTNSIALHLSSSSSSKVETFHTVKGIQCREVNIDVSSSFEDNDDNGGLVVTVLEATAESQEELVHWAIEEEGNGLKAGDPYGAVLWPAASATAQYLLTYLKNLEQGSSSCSILELGAGTGLVSIAAALGGASKIMASDYEQIPLDLLEYAKDHCNNPQNDDVIKKRLESIETSLLDICDLEDQPLPYADVVVAADIMYEPKTGRAMAQRAIEALKQNSRVIVGCSPGRPGQPAFLEELKRLGLTEASFFDAKGTTCSGDRHDLICGKESTSISQTPQPLTVKLIDLLPTDYNSS